MRTFLASLVLALSLAAQSPTFVPSVFPGHSPSGDGYGWRPCCGAGPLLPNIHPVEVPGYRARVGYPYSVRPSFDTWPACPGEDRTGWVAGWAFSVDLLPYPIAYPWPQCHPIAQGTLTSMHTGTLGLVYGIGWVSTTSPPGGFRQASWALPGESLATVTILPNNPTLVGRTMFVQFEVNRRSRVTDPSSPMFGFFWWTGRMYSDVATVEIAGPWRP